MPAARGEWGTDQEMEVIGHQDEADDFPPGPGDLSGQQLLESSSIMVVLHDVLAGVAPRHDVVDGPLELASQSSRHRSTRPEKLRTSSLTVSVTPFSVGLMIRRTRDGVKRLAGADQKGWGSYTYTSDPQFV